MAQSQTFKLQVRIKKQPDDQTVYYKVDGGRFEEEKTIKMNVNSKYSMEFMFKPPQTVESATIQHNAVTLEEKKRDEECVVFKADWPTTGVDRSKKGNRFQIPVVFTIHQAGSLLEVNITLKVNFQVKFYPEKEKDHTNWGTAINYIDMDCKVAEGGSYVDVIRENYR